MDKIPISLACRMDSERAIKLTKKIFEFLVKKGEVVQMETRIAPFAAPAPLEKVPDLGRGSPRSRDGNLAILAARWRAKRQPLGRGSPRSRDGNSNC